MERYLKKDYLLIAATLVFGVACYELAFKNTISAWHLNRELNKRLLEATDVRLQPAFFGRKKANLNRVLSFYHMDTANFRSNVISRISSVADAENVKLAGVPPAEPIYPGQRLFVQQFDFEGDYFSLLKVFQHLEENNEGGVIRSAVLKSESKENGIKNQKITLQLFLENEIK